jgi:peptidoglycan/xylan/chitin deacetylase (PgdA/CDA1 family)
MNWRRIAVRGVSEVFAAARNYSKPRKGVRILLYHAIGSRVNNDDKGIFSVTSGLFESQMAALVSYNDAMIRNLISSEPVTQLMSIAVTFDDGYKDNLSVATPILEKYKIPFTVFVTTDFIRSGSDLYLSPKELQELSVHPLVTIGSHGVSHIPLTLCDDQQLHNELLSSKHYLEDLTGNEISTIAYPHGAVDMRVRAAVEMAGYRSGVSSIFDINTLSNDPLQLCRTLILGNDSLRVFKQKLHGDWDWCRRRPSTFPAPLP